ncbi:hypothetical protein [Streptomyces sp. F001]|uniref:hypothetical protein n=1 Tax=Streptomyces sp. F001 TaxID=1510026 RepID=UPI00101E4828|nr:hypothetical protein [Streptomyces sp. F001]
MRTYGTEPGMTSLTPQENLWLGVLAELRNSPAIHVYKEYNDPIDDTLGDASAAMSEIAEDYDIHLDASFHETYTRFGGIGSSWRTTEEYPFISGEFHIASVQLEIEQAPPELGWRESPIDDPHLMYQLRTIDGTPDSGVGTLAAVRVLPGVTNPEIWFDHGRRGAWKLDLDYRGYMETLRVTKGTFGWQYLFTDVSLRGDDFGETGRRLSDMLTVFPELFPGYDYQPLRRRLAARLR